MVFDTEDVASSLVVSLITLEGNVQNGKRKMNCGAKTSED